MVPLESSRFASQLARPEQEFLKQHVQSRRFVDGQRVFLEGATADGLYVVHSGIIEITVSSGLGREHLLGRMEPGDYFGEMAVFDGRERSASATARGECVLYFVPSAIALSLLERSPLFAAALVRDASLRTRDFNRRFLRESLRAERLTMVERLARTIVHDFRNPLNVIGIAADIAAEESATLLSRRSARDRVRKQVEVLNSLMQELLDQFPNSAAIRINTALALVANFRTEEADRVLDPVQEDRLRLDEVNSYNQAKFEYYLLKQDFKAAWSRYDRIDQSQLFPAELKRLETLKSRLPPRPAEPPR